MLFFGIPGHPGTLPTLVHMWTRTQIKTKGIGRDKETNTKQLSWLHRGDRRFKENAQMTLVAGMGFISMHIPEQKMTWPNSWPSNSLFSLQSRSLVLSGSQCIPSGKEGHKVPPYQVENPPPLTLLGTMTVGPTGSQTEKVRN